MESFDITAAYEGGYEPHGAAKNLHSKLENHTWVYLTLALAAILVLLLVWSMAQKFVQEKYTETNTVGSAYAKPPPLPMTFSGSRVSMQNTYPESGLGTGDGPANAQGVCQPGGSNDDAYAWMLAHYNDPDADGRQRFQAYIDPATGMLKQGFAAGPAASQSDLAISSTAAIGAMHGYV
jgi:hypothetical protein